MKKAIIAKNITKKYKLYNGTKERLLDLVSPKNIGEDFYALSDVSFEAEKGDIIGFIGMNGSGKSTLSNIVAGIVPQTSGEVEIDGETALIAVASGLKGDLSGRDNIELKLLMLGFNKKEIQELEPGIIEFSELEAFIDQPVKSYSSGMKSRLGFAISVSVDPDILIIDEALSVGDKAFASKSFAKMMEFKEKGKTMIFVSHSIGQMKQFCEKILWLEYGKVKEYGDADEVIPQYETFLVKWGKLSKGEREVYKSNILTGAPVDENIKMLEKIEVSKGDTYKEDYTSLLGHIKGGSSYIYSNPTNQEEEKSSDAFKNSVYYIKKQVSFQGDTYYLLSEERSIEIGTIGWMNSTDLSVHLNLSIDEDSKVFYIIGEGIAYSKPWGGRNNIVIRDLKPFKDNQFQVTKTEKVGKNVWYQGILNNQKVWLHSNHVTSSEVSKSS